MRRLARRIRRLRTARSQRNEWRSRIAHYCGPHTPSSDFEGARD